MSKLSYRSYFPHFLSAACLVFAFSSCGHNDSDDENHGPIKSKIVLSEAIAPEGCLSVPLYLAQLRSLSPALSTLEITNHIDFKSKKAIRHNYEILSSFGAFNYSTVSISKLQQIQDVTQKGCESFTIKDASGTATVYKIKENAKDRVSGESESGLRVSYHWLGETRMEIITNSISYDVPCGSELNPIFVEQTKVYDWSGEAIEKVALDSPLAVERSYLEKVSEATGRDIKEFYSIGEDGTQGFQLVSKLREIPSLSPRPELLACPDTTPPPDDNNGDNNSGDHSGDEPTVPPPAPRDGSDHSGDEPTIPPPAPTDGGDHSVEEPTVPPHSPHDGSVGGSWL